MMRRLTVVVALGAAVVGIVGCVGFRTERNGRDVGRAICDLKHADNADQAQRALAKLNRDLADAQRITGRKVSEDVSDIQNNINDLAVHASKERSAAAAQDVAAIQRNVQVVIQTAPGLTRRFYEGVNEGLGDCT